MNFKQSFPILIFLIILIFFLFRSLFNSYFEADEWVHLTYYLPLTGREQGFLNAFISTIAGRGFITGEGQHINPIGTVIFFLNTKFFGLNFAPYAFMSLLLHALNSFLVFVFIKLILHREQNAKKNTFGILGAIFFALAPTPMHAVTGAAAFYSYNILSVTFFLACIISFKLGFIKKQKKIIYTSIVFLFLALFSKETSVFLFALLPLMAIMEKRIFPVNFLAKVFVASLVIYAVFRFLIPNVYQGIGPLIEKLIGNYVSSSIPDWQQSFRETKVEDTGTIVSRDISIHKNLPAEVLFRSITFPIKMTGTLFLPRDTLTSIVRFIAPIIYPAPSADPGARATGQLGFVVGPGNDAVLYLVSIGIIVFLISLMVKFIQKRQFQEAKAIATGFAIIILSALPLVAVIFSFPRWGYDTYFDSRHYYNPNVGAAIVFPFLLLGLAEIVSKTFRIRAVLVVIVLFIIWFVNNMHVFGLSIKQFAQNYGPDRREVVNQLKQYLPVLPKNVVIYTETDGLSAYGPNLPFLTSVPQALTIVYYDKNPLPDGFFERPLFDGEGEGYQYLNGRGFGYYTSKKTLSEALLAGDFEVSDIYAFYYEAQKVKLNDITLKIRKEMEEYLVNVSVNLDWKSFTNASGFSLLYPPQTIVIEGPNSFRLEDPRFIVEIFVSSVPLGFDINEYVKISLTGTRDEAMPKKVSFDKFHYNDAVVIIGDNQNEYFIKLDDRLIQLKTGNMNNDSLQIIEQILGSIELIEQK